MCFDFFESPLIKFTSDYFYITSIYFYCISIYFHLLQFFYRILSPHRLKHRDNEDSHYLNNHSAKHGYGHGDHNVGALPVR